MGDIVRPKECSCNKEVKTVLVTGAGGYVGSHTVLELINNDYTVIALDNLSNCYSKNGQKPESLKRVEQITGKLVTFYRIDIKIEPSLDKIFRLHKIDYVIHCAALKSVGESVQHPLVYYRNNLTGSSVLFEVMEANGVKKIVFSSSATVYGNPQSLPLFETHPTGQNITNPYGNTKYFTEELLKDLCKSNSDWKVVMLRFFNPVGAHESGLLGEDPLGTPNNLMPYISQVAVGRREKLQIFGNDYDTKDGTGVRDYVHVVDVASGHVKALEKLQDETFQGYKAYNLGTGRGCSVLELVDAFSKACGKKIDYEIVGRREGDVAVSFADVCLAKHELKWKAKRTVEDMCADTWKWQSNNPDGYQK